MRVPVGRSRIRFTPRLALCCTAAAAAMAAGCSLFQKAEPARGPTSRPVPASRPIIEEQRESASTAFAVPGVLQAVDRPVAQGPLPQIYLVEWPGKIRITNVDTGEEVMVVDAKPPEILRVEARGISLEGNKILGAALAPGTYAITPLSKDIGMIHAERTITTPRLATSKPSVQADTPPPQ